MTPEEKELLVKDLCGRLPYRVKVKCEKYSFPVTVFYAGDVNEVKFKETGGIEHIDEIKLYLRPMSSMTEEEIDEYDAELDKDMDIVMDGSLDKDRHITSDGKHTFSKNFVEHFGNDWLDAHHFDYRGLILMGLALEAPEDMYKTE